jgi:hypothetical protein
MTSFNLFFNVHLSFEVLWLQIQNCSFKMSWTRYCVTLRRARMLYSFTHFLSYKSLWRKSIHFIKLHDTTIFSLWGFDVFHFLQEKFGSFVTTFGYRMVRRVFESKCETVTGECRKLGNYKFHNFLIFNRLY